MERDGSNRLHVAPSDERTILFDMDATPDPLSLAAALLLVAAAALLRSGHRQRRFRGGNWWVAAIALGASGLALSPAARSAAGMGGWLALPLVIWPLPLLWGMRHFHARQGLPGSAGWDALVLGGAAVVLLVAGSALAASPATWGAVAALLVSHLYAAAVVASGRVEEDLVARRLMAAGLALATLVPTLLLAFDAVPADGGARLFGLGSALALTVSSFALLAMMSDRTERELRHSRRRLSVLANIDSLTGVPNRRHFQELARRALRAPAKRLPVLLLFDVDHFKVINDQLGHAAGDRALQLVGRCVDESLRARDLAGRLGGDEFVLLLGEATLTQAMAVADRLVTQLQSTSAEHRLPCLALSFGLVQVQPNEALDDALRRADLALYEAKRQGRSRAVAAHGAEDEPVFSESQRLGLV